jgi:predicted transcriptional regulator
MARPAAKELTERELEVMQVFWHAGEITAAEARDRLASNGLDLAYVTVANLVRIIEEKGFLTKTNQERPFTYRPSRSFDEVSGSLVHDLVHRVFKGSREKLLLNVLKRRRLSAKERSLLREILEEAEQ